MATMTVKYRDPNTNQDSEINFSNIDTDNTTLGMLVSATRYIPTRPRQGKIWKMRRVAISGGDQTDITVETLFQKLRELNIDNDFDVFMDDNDAF